MDSDDSLSRRRLIFEKGNANMQRRNREATLSRLSAGLSDALAHCPCIYSPAIDQIIRFFLPISPDGIGRDTRRSPAGYFFREVAWESEALQTIAHINDVYVSCSAYLLIDPPSVCSFQGESNWTLDVPIFVVDYRWAKSNLAEFWNLSKSFIALVAEDLGTGIVIDSYCGYLEGGHNSREVVYEVATWTYAAASRM